MTDVLQHSVEARSRDFFEVACTIGAFVREHHKRPRAVLVGEDPNREAPAPWPVKEELSKEL